MSCTWGSLRKGYYLISILLDGICSLLEFGWPALHRFHHSLLSNYFKSSTSLDQIKQGWKTRLDKLILFLGAKNGATENRKLWETYLYHWISHIYFSLNLLPTSLGLSWIVFTSFGSSKFLILLLLLLSVGLSIFPSLFFLKKQYGRYTFTREI